MSDRQIEDCLLALAQARGPDKSFCPSDAAKALAEDWRPLMKPVRQAALRLMDQGRLAILRKGKRVTEPEAVRGVIRLAHPDNPGLAAAKPDVETGDESA